MRALSHDMSANLMLLESSLREVRATCSTENPLGELREGLAHAEACLRESKRFLDDLVALGQTGVVQMEPARVELAAVIADVLYEQRPLLAARAIRVVVAPDLPVVWCNPNRVKQVITNLIRNAARHGCSKDDPLIHIETIPCPLRFAGKHGGQAWLRIFDNGRGIPAADQESIFLPGRRLASAAPEGSGMGLAIVRRVVEHFGGRVIVEPGLNTGTAFLLSFPVATAEQASRG